MANLITNQPAADISPRTVALIAGLGLLLMAVGFPPESESGQVADPRLVQPAPVAS